MIDAATVTDTCDIVVDEVDDFRRDRLVGDFLADGAGFFFIVDRVIWPFPSLVITQRYAP